MGERVTVRWRDETRVARRADHYAALRPGEVGLVVDSYGLVSIAVDRGSAAATLRLQPGDAVTLKEPT
jgi:S-adenosylmethionine hydrolase